MTGKIFIDQWANGTSFIDEQQGDAMSESRDYVAQLEAEVERLKAEVRRLIDAGNYFASPTSSRPSDEDIWREAFFALCVPHYANEVKEGYMTDTQATESMLDYYRARWPR